MNLPLLTEKYRPKTLDDLLGFDAKIEIDDSLPHLLLHGTAGTGKCLGINTPIIMYDGSIKMVQDIKENDIIMGPDSTSRHVNGVTKGEGKLYKVVPVKGDAFICNEDHILNLRKSGTSNTINISVKDYINKSTTFKRKYKIWRTSIEFPEKELSLDPYIVGLWIGDGKYDSPYICHTMKDTEIISDMERCAKKLGINLTYWHDEKHNTGIWKFGNGRTGGKPNPFMILVKKCIINNEKRIPQEYLINSKKNRLELLAGLIDTDGYRYSNCIEIVTKYEGLSKDIQYLAKSLGFYASVYKKSMGIKKLGFLGEYYKIHISGNTHQIPIRIKRKQCSLRKQIKDVTNSGFSIEYIGIGNYYGFTLDGDGLFLLGDFTVTHNTTLAKIIIRQLGCDVLTLNASSERGIDTVRDKVKEFASNRSKDGNIKIVFLDEADHLTGDAQTALRNTMETYSRNTRFILTCNYLNKIIEPLKSRCVLIKFGNIPREDILHRLEYICVQEKIPYEKEALDKIVARTGSDLRSAINSIEEHRDGILLSKFHDEINLAEKVFSLICEKNFILARQTLLDECPDYDQFCRDLSNIAYERLPPEKYQTFICILSDKYQWMSQVAIKEILIEAMLAQLMKET